MENLFRRFPVHKTYENILTPEQIQTITSYKTLLNTELLEVVYTADYKMDQFIETITEQNTIYGEDMRKIMHDIIAPNSDVLPDQYLSNATPGCTTVIAQDGITGNWLAGRNYDLDINSNGTISVIHTAPEGKYKSVGVADTGLVGLSKNELANDAELLLYAPYFTMDGVNEEGFAISIMVLNKDRSTQDDPEKASLPQSLLVRYLLDNADSVQSAIKLLENVNLKNEYLLNYKEIQRLMAPNVAFHWSMVDESGDKAIIEYVNGKMNVITIPPDVQYDEQTYTPTISYPQEPKPYLINTNFFLSQEVINTPNEDGFWRYATAQKALEKNPTPSKEELVDIMQSVKFFLNDVDEQHKIQQKGKDPNNPQDWEWITLWTDILDTEEKSLKLFYREDYTREYNFDVVKAVADQEFQATEAMLYF